MLRPVRNFVLRSPLCHTQLQKTLMRSWEEVGVVCRAVRWGKGKEKIFLAKIFLSENIFGKNIFDENIFGKNIFFLPFPHLTALQTTPTSSQLLISDFWSWVWQTKRNHGPDGRNVYWKYKYRLTSWVDKTGSKLFCTWNWSLSLIWNE